MEQAVTKGSSQYQKDFLVLTGTFCNCLLHDTLLGGEGIQRFNRSRWSVRFLGGRSTWVRHLNTLFALGAANYFSGQRISDFEGVSAGLPLLGIWINNGSVALNFDWHCRMVLWVRRQ